MSRQYDDPIDVRRRDGVPAEFLWRGRLYVVREVLSCWVETGAWWQAPAARRAYGLAGDDGAVVVVGDTADSDGSVRVIDATRLDAGLNDAGLNDIGLDETEREVWRVDASAGRMRGNGVYDLTFNWSTLAWTLVRALD
ncbi:MAG: DUF6504 family protein [Actinomycetota bacterium]|nr:DUF6504 family protein [Actinomycetota bacterium]